jgi:quercetin dioxygenase-like cupin family protein
VTGPLHRPYPPDLYRGTSGETSAWIRTADAEPEITYRSGGTCEYLATGDQTGTTFGLYRWTFGPSETGPDPHFHRAITESFYVLNGEVSLYDGTGWKSCRPGDFAYVPEGGLHGFKGGNHSSMLLMFTPGAPREAYFEDLAGLAENPMTEEERTEFMLRHDTYWV